MEITLKDGGTIGIGSIPGRKRKAIYRVRGAVIETMAYFASDDDAEWVKEFVQRLCEIANARFEGPNV